MIILTPAVIDVFIRKIPKGWLVTINTIRSKFAKDYRTVKTCPITTGIFTWISAWASEEQNAAELKRITPYGRVLKE